MENAWIKNKRQLAKTPARAKVLEITEAGYNAIDTECVVKNTLRLEGPVMTIKDQQFNLNNFEHVYILGFGKASAKAALALEDILGSYITDGIVISIKTASTKRIRTYVGTHPLPSYQNVEIAERMREMIAKITEKDLVINLVSGGGSALLCWTKEECDQGIRLYQNYLKTGEDIKSLNTVRKHISLVKGGGLAKMLYPATVVSLIFSDVAGNNYHFVDSGPTYKDASTIADAKSIVNQYNLGEYDLLETPKDDKYFEKVYNIPVVSNVLALEAMAAKAQEMGLSAKIISAELFDTPDNTLKRFAESAQSGTVLLGGSEIKLIIGNRAGVGGRNTYLALAALPYITGLDVFAAVASDGIDNTESAGAIVDRRLTEKIKISKMDPQAYLDNFDSYTFFQKLGDGLFMTGPTEANVSDFLVWYRE